MDDEELRKEKKKAVAIYHLEKQLKQLNKRHEELRKKTIASMTQSERNEAMIIASEKIYIQGLIEDVRRGII